MDTDYKGRCPQCANRDYFKIQNNIIICKKCGFRVGAVLSPNVEVTILPTWSDFARWRKTIFNNKDSASAK